MILPQEYIGREQAYIKHQIISHYLTRLFMIIGRGPNSETTINYVDCFAGPWQDESENLKNTSIGISLAEIKKCAEGLLSDFNCFVKFRALYIEKDTKAFERLKSFVQKQHDSGIEVSCLHGDYTNLMQEIIDWGKGYFTFFFIDPKGWKGIIGGKTLEPLLKLQRSEFLINFMYDFANRAVSIETHEEDMVELLGYAPNVTGNIDSIERQNILLSLYRENVNSYYQGWTSYVPIEKPGKDRVLYFLVYLTRHPLGIKVFKEIAQDTMIVQRITQREVKLRRQLEQTATVDMFGDDSDGLMPIKIKDNRLVAKELLLKNLSKKPMLINYERWAKWLEVSDLYPNDLQLAMRELVKDERVINIDADVQRRTKNIVRPDWPRKSERWCLS